MPSFGNRYQAVIKAKEDQRLTNLLEFSNFFGLFILCIRLPRMRAESDEFFTAVDWELLCTLASMRHADLPR